MMDAGWLKDRISVHKAFNDFVKPLFDAVELDFDIFQCAVALWENHISEHPEKDSQWQAMSLMYHIASQHPRSMSIQTEDKGPQARLKNAVVCFAFQVGFNVLCIGIDEVDIVVGNDETAKKAKDECINGLRASYPMDDSKRGSMVDRLTSELRVICKGIQTRRDVLGYTQRGVARQ